MLDLLAHITPTDTPALWLAVLIGFVAGAGVTFALLARKLR